MEGNMRSAPSALEDERKQSDQSASSAPMANASMVNDDRSDPSGTSANYKRGDTMESNRSGSKNLQRVRADKKKCPAASRHSSSSGTTSRKRKYEKWKPRTVAMYQGSQNCLIGKGTYGL